MEMCSGVCHLSERCDPCFTLTVAVSLNCDEFGICFGLFLTESGLRYPNLVLVLLRYVFLNFDSVTWKLVQSDFRYDLEWFSGLIPA